MHKDCPESDVVQFLSQNNDASTKSKQDESFWYEQNRMLVLGSSDLRKKKLCLMVRHAALQQSPAQKWYSTFV